MAINVDKLLYVAGAIITITAAVKILFTYLRGLIEEISQRIITEAVGEIEEKLVVALKESTDELYELMDHNCENDKTTLELTLKNAKARIFEGHSHYMRRGSITTFALANLEEVYRIYEAQGGNSHAGICIRQLRDLPIIERPWENKVVEEELRVERKKEKEGE